MQNADTTSGEQCGRLAVGGKEVLFDAADANLIAGRAWYLSTTGHVLTASRWPDGRRRTVGMHRIILGDPPYPAIDHINRNPLDNRRANLRACSHSENNMNRPTAKNKTSRYRGVSARGSRWQVVVRIDGKPTYLGCFESEDEAGAVAAPYFEGIAP
jgi:hypothetical protein